MPEHRSLRIGIDLTPLLPEPTGVDVALLNLVRSLSEMDQQNRYTLFVNREDRGRFGALPSNFSFAPLCWRPRPARLCFQQVILPAAATVLGLEVVHSPSFLMPLIRGRARHLLTVHDMTMFSLPSLHIQLRRSPAFLRMVRWGIRRADLVSVPSRFVGQEIRRVVPGVPAERIRVIGHGVASEFRPRPADEIRRALARLGLAVPYILCVGTIEPRKNVLRLLEAYRGVAPGVPEHLVLAGRLGWNAAEVLERLAEPALRERVHRIGYVSAADLPLLYAGATVFIYPSLAEGFGLPALEAMACGVPTVTSRGSALGENFSGAAVLVSPESVEELEAAMRRLLAEPKEREELRERGLDRARRFRWEDTARKTLACYEDLGGLGQRTAASAA